MPYISGGLCTGCYFWPGKTVNKNNQEIDKNYDGNFHCPGRKTVISCFKYVVNGKEVNVIFKEVRTKK
jgi:hypothetical protein